MEGNKKRAKADSYKENAGRGAVVELSAEGTANAPEGDNIFFTGLTTAEMFKNFTPEFLDAQECRLFVLHKLHPAGVFCPSCAARIDRTTQVRRFWTGKKLSCPACGGWFTALSGTWLSRSQLDFRQIVLLLLLSGLMAKNITPAATAELVGVSADTVRFYIKKFKILKAGQYGK